MHCGNYGQQTGEGWTQLGYSLEVPAKTILPIDSSNDEFPVGKTKIPAKPGKSGYQLNRIRDITRKIRIFIYQHQTWMWFVTPLTETCHWGWSSRPKRGFQAWGMRSPPLRRI